MPLMMSLSPDDISRNDGKLQLVLNLSSSRVIENRFFFAFPLYFQPSPAEQGQRSKTLSACPQDLTLVEEIALLPDVTEQVAGWRIQGRKGSWEPIL